MRLGIVVILVIVAAVSAPASAGPEEADSRSDRATGTPDAATTKISIRIDRGEASPIPLDSLSIVITYDNYTYREGLQTEWGFSCVVTGPEKTILFDTGGEGSVLLDNMAKLGIEPREIDIIVLSHVHGDHTGGLGAFLKANPDVTVYLLESFGNTLKKKAKDSAREVVEVDDAVEICKGVHTTGEMGYSIREQGLIVETDEGLVVITGCAHPGIVEMVGKARSVTGGDVLLVLGGFHLVRAGKDEIGDVIAGLKDAGVRYAAPCHCTGDMAREMFLEEFGPKYIPAGVGRSFAAPDLN